MKKAIERIIQRPTSPGTVGMNSACITIFPVRILRKKGQVIAGNFNSIAGPAATYSAVNLFDIRLNKDRSLITGIPAKHNTALLVINGSINVSSENAAEHSFVLFNKEGEDIIVDAREQAVVLLLSGEPINEPIVSYGPFVMNSREEIYEAIQEFQAGNSAG